MGETIPLFDYCDVPADRVTIRGATFSPCRTWRYRLWRVWDGDEDDLSNHVAFIGINPSTADEYEDDPTMRRCRGFAERWGFSGFQMLNLFGARTKYPKVLAERHGAGEDVVGFDNGAAIRHVARSCKVVVAAWGACTRRHERERADVVAEVLLDAGVTLHCLGLTKSNQRPRHPLFVPYDDASAPIPWLSPRG